MPPNGIGFGIKGNDGSCGMKVNAGAGAGRCCSSSYSALHSSTNCSFSILFNCMKSESCIAESFQMTMKVFSLPSERRPPKDRAARTVQSRLHSNLDRWNSGVLNVQTGAWSSVRQVEAGVVGEHVAGQIRTVRGVHVRHWGHNVAAAEIIQFQRRQLTDVPVLH